MKKGTARKARTQSPKTGTKGRATGPKSTGATAAAAAYGSTQRTSEPRFSSSTFPGIRVSHAELAGTFDYTASGFKMWNVCQLVPGMDINPGVDHLFPWLSTVAGSFERYRFTKLRFRLVSANATSVGGRVYMAVDYDYDDPVATSAGLMMANRTAVEGPVWFDLELAADPKYLMGDMPTKYINRAKRFDAIEPRTSYGGFLMVAADSLSSLRFDLWVEYEVELLIPQLTETTLVTTYTDVPVVTANVTTAVAGQTAFPGGQGNAILYASTGTVPANSPIKELVPGSPGVPLMKVSGTQQVYPRVLDIERIIHDGAAVVESAIRWCADGLSPQAVIASSLLKGGYEVFNAIGERLGNALPSLHAFGPVEPSEVATAGKDMRFLMDLSMSSIASLYPTARYLAPLFLSTAAIAGGAVDQGFRVAW